MPAVPVANTSTGGSSAIGPLLRRRRYVVLRVSDEPILDVCLFLRGKIDIRVETQCALLCPLEGTVLPLTTDELRLVMGLSVDHWVPIDEASKGSKSARRCLLDLASRGILISDPAPVRWRSLLDDERVLQHTEWFDLAAVYDAHSRWEDVIGANMFKEYNEDAHRARLEDLIGTRGIPPPHFVRRQDAKTRMPLTVPELNGAYFEALLARRTTRAFRSDEALPLSLLELMLYSVFGAHGIKQFAEGVYAIKRTSPSGGALHPIEAYLLAINVESLPSGLYHYESETHSLAELERIEGVDVRDLAFRFTAGQTYFGEAHALVIHVARFDRIFWKYAQHRKAYKAVLMDSAHLSQTFYLTAAHLGLGAFYTGAINDANIDRRLKLPRLRESAIAINGLGLPAVGRDEMHFVTEPYQVKRDSSELSAS